MERKIRWRDETSWTMTDDVNALVNDFEYQYIINLILLTLFIFFYSALIYLSIKHMLYYYNSGC